MGKKNPYITTIGFDKTDPRHVQVAELLNSMTRKKAQYIVDAILAYQEIQGQGMIPKAVSGMEYGQIRAIVLQVMAEQRGENQNQVYDGIQGKAVEEQLVPEESEEFDFEPDALEGIMQSIAAFRE